MKAIFPVINWLVVAVALVMLALALTPVTFGFAGTVLSPMAHIFGTAVVAVAVANFLRWRYGEIRAIWALAFVAAGTSTLLWIVIELCQSFVPNHGTELSDVGFDLAGFGLGAVVITLEAKIRQGLVQNQILRRA